jgi:hypothetical protein
MLNVPTRREFETCTSVLAKRSPWTAPLLKEMRNPDGTPRVCDKVWMSNLNGPYGGSAKILAQMGQAFATANLRMMKKP